ncbi:MAG: DNA polymerase/3'-5' exonuclease PolX [Candidatus Omnitrophica bacterium]|nr:DNA polymerase/3'-5' exonuclease PolX [Candidatus Omnitrophota bacterium]
MAQSDITGIFQEIADLMEILEENTFKIRAYQNAARTLGGVSDTLEDLVRENKLQELPGIGEGIAKKVVEFLKTGKVRFHEELRKKVPEGLLEMLRIQGMGPKKVKAVWKGLKISSISDLERACRENRLANLEGFGAKSQENILKGIGYLKKSSGQFLFAVAIQSAEPILKRLEKHKAVRRVSLAGSLRRRKEVIKDIDFVVSTENPGRVMKFFTEMDEVDAVTAHGETKSSVKLKNGINVDLRAVSDKEFPYALHHLTGSVEHNTAMRTRAKKAGYKMNEYGLFKGRRLVACKDEREIFEELGLTYIEPELRENMGEIEAAMKGGKLPHLVEEKDIRGVFHVHTTYSDGKAPLEVMVRTAEEMGLEYVGISDHSQSASYANGLKADRVSKQQKEIDALNKKRNIRIFKGTECDILADGAMDFSEKVLASFDFVIASVHSLFNMSKLEMTKRIVRALKNKHVTMLGHATGRLLLSREEYAVDLNEVIEAAVGEGKVIELNANPYRLDLDWRVLKGAKEKGLRVSINPDAHNTVGLADIAYGVGIARKGWLEAKDVINTMPLNRMIAYLAGR